MLVSRKRKHERAVNGRSNEAKVSYRTKTSTSTRRATFKTTDKYVNVRHKEYIGPIYSSSGFTWSLTSINPGLPGSFPWLSGVAENFESYKFKKLTFHFRSTCEGNPTTLTNLGTVMMAPQYNVESEQPDSKQQFESWSGCISDKPIKSMKCNVNTNMGPVKKLNVRVNATSTSSIDLRLYDIADFYVATAGMNSTGTILGELWVSYDINLYRPKLVNEMNPQSEFWRFDLSGEATISGGYPVGTKQYLPMITGYPSVDSKRVIINTTADSSLNFDPSVEGVYSLVMYWEGSGTATTVYPPSLTLTSNITVNTNVFLPFNNSSTTASKLVCVWYLNIETANLSKITLSAAQLPATLTKTYITLARIGPLQ